MVNNHKELYVNITYFKGSAIIRYEIPNYTTNQYGIPNITIIEKNLEKMTESILELEKKHSPKKVKISNIKSEGASDEEIPAPKKTLTQICNKLNKERKEEEKIFKLSA